MAIPEKTLTDSILVTGASGYIGSHLRKLTSFISLPGRVEDFNPSDKKYSNIRYVIHLADLRLDAINKDNLAGNIQRHHEFVTKVTTLPIIEGFIFSSSCSVYGHADHLLTEISAVNPTSFYAESKLATEEIIRSSKLPAKIARFGTAHGWSENMRHDLFINQVAQAKVRQQEMEIYSADAWRPYIHCKDFALYLMQSLNKFEAGLVNVVTENLTKRQILESSLLSGDLHIKYSGKPDPRNYQVKTTDDLQGSRILFESSLKGMIEQYGYQQA